MKSVLIAGLLALGALSVLPASSAMELPPPCQTADMSTCCPMDPAFAPCCSVLTCPPPYACQEQQVDETDVLAIVLGPLGPLGMVYTGPHLGARLNGDCTADAWATWDESMCLPNLLPLAYQEQAVDAGAAGATVASCGVGFICACMPADLSSASVQPPSPCGPTALCEGPAPCVPRELQTVGLPVQVTVRIQGSCLPAVAESGTPCPGPTAPAPVHVDGLVPVAAEACSLSVDCTCDPLPIDRVAAASLPPIFQPCPGMGGCCGIEPEGGCPPSTPTCPEAYVSTTQFFGFLGPSAAVATHPGCTVDVYVSNPACPSLAPNEDHDDAATGPVRLHADTCRPSLDCTCDPLPIEATSAAAIQPPVTVEFPVCVTDPCPPKVTCHVAPRDLGVATVTVTQDCQATIVEAPPGCQSPYPKPTTVGPVTVTYWTCGPGPTQ